MTILSTPGYRALAVGAAAGALLVGAFAVGASRGAGGSAAAAAAGRGGAAAQLAAVSSGPARITVTGTGTVSGTPDQLVLSMGVQASAASVGAALQQADQAVRRVTGTLRRSGVAAADLQTSGLSIQPAYQGSSQTPDGYGVAESLTATLRHIATAGAQIGAAVRAGGNAVTVDGISLNLADDSGLLAAARAAAVADAKVKAGQYARAIGRPLDGVVSITDQAPQNPVPMFAPNATAGTSKSVPISPGSQRLSVSITVIFAVG
jgi:uncharacterized protein YggE